LDGNKQAMKQKSPVAALMPDHFACITVITVDNIYDNDHDKGQHYVSMLNSFSPSCPYPVSWKIIKV